jgi:hypothetical protein
MMPRQKPGRSEQEVSTPIEFIDAVRARFGHLAWDLAATMGTSRADYLSNFYGPGSRAGEDALRQDWTKLTGTLWLNCPFGRIEPWVEKARVSAAEVAADPDRRDRHDWRLCMLVPASVGSNWFADHVHRRALVLALRPRLTFVSHRQPFPKDLALLVYGERPGFDCWKWS